jgi:hypothetical protein
MTTDLERTLAAALRNRADSVPGTPMPVLGEVPPATPHRRGRLLPAAAAVVAAVGIAGAVVALTPDDHQLAPPAHRIGIPADPYELSPGEVYYSRSVRGNGDDDRYIEVEVWQSPRRTGPWQQHAIVGASQRHGRVVPDPHEKPEDTAGTCFPFESAATVGCKQKPSWPVYPSLDFLAGVPSEPGALRAHLRAAAVADAQQLVHDGVLPAGVALSERDLSLRMRSYLEQALAGNGISPALRTAMRKVVASLPGTQVSENVADRIGRRGTGYSLEDPATGERETMIFAGDVFLGTPIEALVHGVAPALGEPPSRLLP